MHRGRPFAALHRPTARIFERHEGGSGRRTSCFLYKKKEKEKIGETCGVGSRAGSEGSRRRHGAHRRRAPAIRAAVGVPGGSEGGEEEAPGQGGLRRGRGVRGGGPPQVLRGGPAEEGGGGGGEGPGQAPGHGARRGGRGQGEGPLGEPSVSPSPSSSPFVLVFDLGNG